MSQEVIQNDLMSAFLETGISEKVVVKAEEIEYGGGGINFKEIFFEPQPGKSYVIKLVKNPNGDDLTHRKIYKKLPDPDRRGKTFQYIQDPSTVKTDPVLQLFFDLNTEKKAGNALAEKKIKDYLNQTNQGCTIVQIVKSNDDYYKPGEFKLFVFSTFGPNATIANLINEALNPTQAQIDDGVKPNNLWNVFGSKQIFVEVGESEYDGNKGRDFTKSKLSNKEIGVMVPFEDGSTHTFSEKDILETNEQGVATKITDEAMRALKRLTEIMQDEKLSVHNYFAWKAIDDPRNTDSTNEYLKKVLDKVGRIIPIIREAKTIESILNACAEDTSAPSENKDDKSKNILSESIPAELAETMMGEATNTQPAAQVSQPSIDSSNQEAASMLDEDDF